MSFHKNELCLLQKEKKSAAKTSSGVENISDYRTIGPRKFFGIPENIQDSLAKEENVKQILTSEITFKFRQENRTFLAIKM